VARVLAERYAMVLRSEGFSYCNNRLVHVKVKFIWVDIKRLKDWGRIWKVATEIFRRIEMRRDEDEIRDVGEYAVRFQ
jgi:hypothetical protein